MAGFPSITEELSALEERLRREKHPLRKQRLHLLVLIRREAVTMQREAAEHLAVHPNTVHPNTVRRWLARYRQGGLDALLHVGKAGAPSGQRLLSPHVLAALKKRLDEDGFASFKEAQQWLEDAFDLPVNYKSLHKFIRYRLGAKLKRSRPRHAKRAWPKGLTS